VHFSYERPTTTPPARATTIAATVGLPNLYLIIESRRTAPCYVYPTNRSKPTNLFVSRVDRMTGRIRFQRFVIVGIVETGILRPMAIKVT
jgi:hypothetical protein